MCSAKNTKLSLSKLNQSSLDFYEENGALFRPTFSFTLTIRNPLLILCIRFVVVRSLHAQTNESP